MDPVTPPTVKMRDVIERLDTPETPLWENTEKFIQACNVDAFWMPLADNGFTIRPIDTWTCTDTEVGLKLICLDGEPICVSFQDSRKGAVKYDWVSREAYDKARARVLSLVEQEERNKPVFLDMDAEIAVNPRHTDINQIPYGRDATYNGQRVEVLISETLAALQERGVSRYSEPGCREVVIRCDGEEKRVAVADLTFPIKLRPLAQP